MIELDEDGDGKISGTEVVVQLMRSIKEAMSLNTERDVAQEQRDFAAAESRKWRKRSFGRVVLFRSTHYFLVPFAFGISI